MSLSVPGEWIEVHGKEKNDQRNKKHNDAACIHNTSNDWYLGDINSENFNTFTGHISPKY